MPDNKEFDPWGGSTGLIDDFDIEITDAKFGYDSGIGDGEAMLLILEGKTDDPDMPVLADEDALKITCGKGWVAEKDGTAAAHESGRAKNFNKQSHYYGFYTRALDLAPELKAKGTPFDAALWKGTSWHMKREDIAYTIKGEEKTSSKLFPTAFLGAGGVSAPSNKTEKAGSATPASATPPAQDNGSTNGQAELDKKTTLLLKKAAQGVDNPTDFQMAAVEIAGLPEQVSVDLMDDDYAAKVFASVK